MAPTTAEGPLLRGRRGIEVARGPAAVSLMVTVVLCLLSVAAGRASVVLRAGADGSYQFEARGVTTVRRVLQSDVNETLWDAASDGDEVRVKEALDAGAYVDFRMGEYNDTPLSIASLHGNVEVAILLIEAGADVNIVDAEGYGPLLLAVYYSTVPIVKALLEAGASTDGVAPGNGTGALFRVSMAGDDELVQRLVEAGQNVEGFSGVLYTPLMVATAMGDAEVVAILLAAGARPDQKDPTNSTALHYAPFGAGPDSENITRTLLKAGLQVNARGNHGRTPLMIAAEYGNVEVLKILLEAGADTTVEDDNGDTAESLVCLCAKASHDPACSDYGCVDGNVKGVILNLLEEAFEESENTMLLQAAKEGDAVLAKEALDQGADIEFRTGAYKVTALWLACLEGHTEVVQVLIEAGADVEAADVDGLTPLFVGVASGEVKVVEALLAAGANTEGLGPDQGVQFVFASHIFEFRPFNDTRVNSLAAVKEHEVDGIEGVVEKPLILAAVIGDAPIVEALLAAGARPDDNDSHNDTALHWAPIKTGPDSENITRALLEAGLPVDVRGNEGTTGLHVAAEFGNVEVVRILLDAGADPSLENDNGDKADDIVCLCARLKVVSFCPTVCREGDARMEIEQLLSTG